MPFPWKKVKSSRISRLVNLSQKRRDAEIQPPEMEITTSKRKSRKAKIKSKMRKIVPKKLRSAKMDRDFGIACDEGEAMIDVAGSVSSSALENGGGEGERDGDGSVCSDRDVIEESDGNGCSEIVEPVAAWRSNMVLCRGRPFALVLTLFCLLVFKLGQGVPMMVKNKV
ncbi:hypothetical protein SASPL_132547 [Salvia splendens]|uniref:Uncharacterized protein n=1 Tax=Salvia splendens TaxID=180675 RepID=A0A8X8ZHL6_SALSN|nr:hypothetical protein SASPL_132547 [Salvia splendens]